MSRFKMSFGMMLALLAVAGPAAYAAPGRTTQQQPACCAAKARCCDQVKDCCDQPEKAECCRKKAACCDMAECCAPKQS